MRLIKVKVTREYELQIEEENEIVREYESENSMLLDCVAYDFDSVLPVIGEGGVKVINVELIEIE